MPEDRDPDAPAEGADRCFMVFRVDGSLYALDGALVDHVSLFESVARSYGAAAAGVLLTGMGRDGARGLLRLRNAGGVTLVQDEVTSSIFGMPGTALELGAAQMTVARQDLADVLVQLVRGARPRPA